MLIKRGKELHAPDQMYLNPDQIVLVEPVGTDSKREAKRAMNRS